MNQKSYAWNSEDYAKHSEVQYQWAQELIGKLDLLCPESVLDIGCGEGKVTALIGSHLPNGSVTGIDTSENMIVLAQKNFPPSKYPNLSFIHLDATKLNFKNQFDIAFSNATLHWVKDHVSVLKGVKKSLKESGRILFQMGGKGNAQDIINVVKEVINKNQWKLYFNHFSFPYTFCSPEEYEQWLKNVGLEPKRIELIPKDMTQKGKDGLAGWIRTTWLPYTERVAENKRDEFIGDIINLYLERFPIDDGGLIHVKMVRLEVEAINP